VAFVRLLNVQSTSFVLSESVMTKFGGMKRKKSQKNKEYALKCPQHQFFTPALNFKARHATQKLIRFAKRPHLSRSSRSRSRGIGSRFMLQLLVPTAIRLFSHASRASRAEFATRLIPVAPI
jgi:hypothetical protein